MVCDPWQLLAATRRERLCFERLLLADLSDARPRGFLSTAEARHFIYCTDPVWVGTCYHVGPLRLRSSVIALSFSCNEHLEAVTLENNILFIPKKSDL